METVGSVSPASEPSQLHGLVSAHWHEPKTRYYDTIVKQFVPMPPSNPTKHPTEFLPLNSDPGQIQVGAPVPPHLIIHGHRSNYYDLPLDLTGMMNSGPSGMNYLEPIVTGRSLNMGSFNPMIFPPTFVTFSFPLDGIRCNRKTVGEMVSISPSSIVDRKSTRLNSKSP